MSSKNTNLNKARKKQDDEFYTRYEDIAQEVVQYKEQLKGKRIYCPCDWDESFERVVCYDEKQPDEEITNKIKSTKCKFVEYLVTRAPDFGIKRVEASGYNPTTKQGIRFQDVDYSDVDIVITNPPFSQFTEFIDVMFENNLKFIVIGPLHAIKYKECFKYIKENKLWLGYTRTIKGFVRPDGSLKSTPALWYTNLDVSYRNKEIILTEEYSPEKYPKYDNFDAIEVSKQKDIPQDYYEPMGVPIRFLQNYNPEQFEILGELNHGSDNEYDFAKPVVAGKEIYSRILIQRKK